jgi:NitT/TauT family transport system permease protein
LVAEYDLLGRILMPFIVGFQSMPKVALAPLLLVWFGFDLTSKVILVGLICFFPMFVNTVAGLRSANNDLVDLYRACSSSRLLIFWDVKLPGAANSIFAGLQIAMVMALLGAVVGEFVASRRGLGYLIQSSGVNFDVPAMFTAVLTLSALGITATFILRKLHSKVVYWEGTTSTRASTPNAQH